VRSWAERKVDEIEVETVEGCCRGVKHILERYYKRIQELKAEPRSLSRGIMRMELLDA
jgi:hypothetical protein